MRLTRIFQVIVDVDKVDEFPPAFESHRPLLKVLRQHLLDFWAGDLRRQVQKQKGLPRICRLRQTICRAGSPVPSVLVQPRPQTPY